MYKEFPSGPIDYLAIGHISKDITPFGEQPGGSALYAALTAQRMGLRAGVVSAWGDDLPAEKLRSLEITGEHTVNSTTFEISHTEQGRALTIRHRAPHLYYHHVPERWRNAPIVHLAPIAQEVDPTLVRNFGDALIGITPQGWLREWKADGKIRLSEWPESSFVLNRAGATILSREDLGNDLERELEIASATRLLVVTCGADGACVYWQGSQHHIPAPTVNIVDATGAGDIFAAAFFIQLSQTRDPFHAAQFATALATQSVTRIGLESIPTADEILNISAQTLENPLQVGL